MQQTLCCRTTAFPVIPGPEAREGAKVALLFLWEANEWQFFRSYVCGSVVGRYSWLRAWGKEDLGQRLEALM